MIKKIALLLSSLLLISCAESEHFAENAGQPGGPNPKAANYNMQLGLGYLEQGKHQLAKRKLITALEQGEHLPEVNGAMAHYLEKVGDVVEAEQYHLRALDLAPKQGAQLNNYGAFLCRQGRYEEADHFFLSAIDDDDYLNVAGAYENAGICASRIPDMAKARYYFQKANAHDPSRATDYLQLTQAELSSQEVV